MSGNEANAPVKIFCRKVRYSIAARKCHVGPEMSENMIYEQVLAIFLVFLREHPTFINSPTIVYNGSSFLLYLMSAPRIDLVTTTSWRSEFRTITYIVEQMPRICSGMHTCCFFLISLLK